MWESTIAMVDNKSQVSESGLNYEWLDHTADIGIRVAGDNLRSLYANAAHAMFDLIRGTLSCEKGMVTALEVKGADRVDLMINWLRELLFLWTGRQRLVCYVEVNILSDQYLKAHVTTIAYDENRHEIGHDLKAVTYHQATVAPYKAGWVAEVIFDV